MKLKAALLAIVLVCFCSSAFAQQDIKWRPLLGPASESTIKRTPRYGIRYDSRGFDDYRKKRIKKSCRWMVNVGATHLCTENADGSLVGPFPAFALAFTGDPNAMPTAIDNAFEEMTGKYVRCGGKWAEAARKADPRKLLVLVEPAPFWSDYHRVWAGAQVQDNTIRANVVVAQNVVTDPRNAYLSKFGDYIAWEAGNYLSMLAGHKPRSVSEEYGNKSPCN